MLELKPTDIVELRRGAELLRVLVVDLDPLRGRLIGTRDLTGWTHRLGSVSLWTFPDDAVVLGNGAYR